MFARNITSLATLHRRIREITYMDTGRLKSDLQGDVVAHALIFKGNNLNTCVIIQNRFRKQAKLLSSSVYCHSGDSKHTCYLSPAE